MGSAFSEPSWDDLDKQTKMEQEKQQKSPDLSCLLGTLFSLCCIWGAGILFSEVKNLLRSKWIPFYVLFSWVSFTLLFRKWFVGKSSFPWLNNSKLPPEPVPNTASVAPGFHSSISYLSINKT